MPLIDIKKEYKTPEGVYILFGEEDYLKRFYASKIRESILGDSAYALFNHTVFTPKDFTEEAAADALATPPMFDDKKLIELSEFNFSEMKANEVQTLIDFFAEAKEYDYIVVLLNLASGAIDYGTAKGNIIKKPSPVYKKLDAVAKTAYLPRATAHELAVWASKHFAKDKISCQGDALTQLVKQSNSDMMTMAGEIEKLCAYLHKNGRDTLTIKDVELICCTTKELEPFGLSNAVLYGKTDEALDILRQMEEKHIRPIIAFSGIYSTYIDLYRIKAALDSGMLVPDIAKKLKMNEYRANIYASAAKNSSIEKIGYVLSLCREDDLKIKSESTNYDRLRTLVCAAARGTKR